MTTSVVTCVFDRALQAERGLRTLLTQEVLPDEIVVVDDGSHDDIRERVNKLVGEFGPILKYIHLDHPEHRISSIPRNVGFKNTTGDVVIFTEPECLHVGNTIKQLIECFEKEPNSSHLASQVWTIQQKIYTKLTEDNFKRPATILNHEYAQLTDNANMSNTKAPDSDWAITGQKNCAAGCLFGVKRKWFEDIGGFDEEFTGHGGDDFNLYDRLALYGHGIVKHDEIITIHQWHEKKYPYNIYDMAERNLSSWKERLEKGEYVANKGKEWGKDT